jgi:hypothetical protein
MKRIMILVAGTIVLLTQASALISVAQNRRDTRGGTIELTERELHLPRADSESTAIFLELEWDTLTAPEDRRRAPLWLDAAKLSALGFDCQLPMTHPQAAAYYKSIAARPVFVVLEYAGQAWKKAPPDRRRQTRLFAIDAGRKAHRLREQYPDRNRFIIVRALVGLIYQDRSVPDYKLLPQPHLQGRIDRIMPNQVFVPLPYNKTLQGLRGRDDAGQDQHENAPRFAATISWGRRYEPWVTAIRRLPGDASVTPGP